MQSSAAQRLKTVEGCETPITHLGMTSHRPLAWEQVRAWTEKETIVEAALVVSTLLLAGLFFFSFHQALQNYVVF